MPLGVGGGGAVWGTNSRLRGDDEPPLPFANKVVNVPIVIVFTLMKNITLL